MNKLLAAAVAILVTLAVLAEREHLEARARIAEMNRQADALEQVHRPIWYGPPWDGPMPYICQPGQHAQLPVIPTTWHADEMP